MKYNIVHKLKTVSPAIHAAILSTVRRSHEVPGIAMMWEGYISGLLTALWLEEKITLEERNELDVYYNKVMKALLTMKGV